MSRRTLARLACGPILVLAACSPTSGVPPVSGPPGTSSTLPSASTSVAPSVGSSVAPSVASVCEDTSDPGVVAVSIEDFAFKPATIAAKTGQVIAFTNTGFEHHNVTLDTGGCATRTLETGESDDLVFTVAGTYPVHCTVHTWMTGTIRISG